MQKRSLGRTGLTVAPLILGGNVFGWTADEPTSFAVLDAFVDAGFNAIDTADVYSAWHTGNKGGESETIIGKWMKDRKNRDKLVIITKVGSEMGPGRKGLKAAYIQDAVDQSLRRLQVETIDLYLSHWPDPDTPYEETLGAYQRLLAEGKIKAMGASNLDAAQLKASFDAAHKHSLPRYDVLQPEYNLYDRSSFEGPLQALCIAEDIGVITYFALAKGFLSGKYRSEADLRQSARGEGIGKYLNARGYSILAALDGVAQRHDAKPAEVALAWLMAQPGVTAPIASATSVDQMQSLAKAAQLKLGKDDLATLTDAGA
jgi:aryl-alcohol dehydrogenase-like predicted oxidoreductase